MWVLPRLHNLSEMQKVHAIWLPRDFDDEGTDVSFIKFHECPSGATQGRDCMRKQPYCLFCQVLITLKREIIWNDWKFVLLIPRRNLNAYSYSVYATNCIDRHSIYRCSNSFKCTRIRYFFSVFKDFIDINYWPLNNL